MEEMAGTSSPPSPGPVDSCLICSSESDLSCPYMPKTLHRIVHHIFHHLQISSRNAEYVLSSPTISKVFCPSCLLIVEDIVQLQSNVDKLQVEIQYKVESLGKVIIQKVSMDNIVYGAVAVRPSVLKNSEIWHKLKNPTVQNFMKRVIPIPKVVMENLKVVTAEKINKLVAASTPRPRTVVKKKSFGRFGPPGPACSKRKNRNMKVRKVVPAPVTDEEIVSDEEDIKFLLETIPITNTITDSNIQNSNIGRSSSTPSSELQSANNSSFGIPISASSPNSSTRSANASKTPDTRPRPASLKRKATESLEASWDGQNSAGMLSNGSATKSHVYCRPVPKRFKMLETNYGSPAVAVTPPSSNTTPSGQNNPNNLNSESATPRPSPSSIAITGHNKTGNSNPGLRYQNSTPTATPASSNIVNSGQNKTHDSSFESKFQSNTPAATPPSASINASGQNKFKNPNLGSTSQSNVPAATLPPPSSKSNIPLAGPNTSNTSEPRSQSSAPPAAIPRLSNTVTSGQNNFNKANNSNPARVQSSRPAPVPPPSNTTGQNKTNNSRSQSAGNAPAPVATPPSSNMAVLGQNTSNRSEPRPQSPGPPRSSNPVISGHNQANNSNLTRFQSSRPAAAPLSSKITGQNKTSTLNSNPRSQSNPPSSNTLASGQGKTNNSILESRSHSASAATPRVSSTTTTSAQKANNSNMSRCQSGALAGTPPVTNTIPSGQNKQNSTLEARFQSTVPAATQPQPSFNTVASGQNKAGNGNPNLKPRSRTSLGDKELPELAMSILACPERVGTLAEPEKRSGPNPAVPLPSTSTRSPDNVSTEDDSSDNNIEFDEDLLKEENESVNCSYCDFAISPDDCREGESVEDLLWSHMADTHYEDVMPLYSFLDQPQTTENTETMRDPLAIAPGENCGDQTDSTTNFSGLIEDPLKCPECDFQVLDDIGNAVPGHKRRGTLKARLEKHFTAVHGGKLPSVLDSQIITVNGIAFLKCPYCERAESIEGLPEKNLGRVKGGMLIHIRTKHKSDKSTPAGRQKSPKKASPPKSPQKASNPKPALISKEPTQKPQVQKPVVPTAAVTRSSRRVQKILPKIAAPTVEQTKGVELSLKGKPLKTYPARRIMRANSVAKSSAALGLTSRLTLPAIANHVLARSGHETYTAKSVSVIRNGPGSSSVLMQAPKPASAPKPKCPPIKKIETKPKPDPVNRLNCPEPECDYFVPLNFRPGKTRPQVRSLGQATVKKHVFRVHGSKCEVDKGLQVDMTVKDGAHVFCCPDCDFSVRVKYPKGRSEKHSQSNAHSALKRHYRMKHQAGSEDDARAKPPGRTPKKRKVSPKRSSLRQRQCQKAAKTEKANPAKATTNTDEDQTETEEVLNSSSASAETVIGEIDVSTSPNPYICAICDDHFDTEEALKTHMRGTHYHCSICGDSCTDIASYEDLLVHRFDHFTAEQKRDAIRKGKDIPKDIRETFISEGRDPLTFEFSDPHLAEAELGSLALELSSQAGLLPNGPVVSRIVAFQPTPGGDECRICGQILDRVPGDSNSEKNNMLHIKRHHINRPAVCNLCGMRFQNEDMVKGHRTLYHYNK